MQNYYMDPNEFQADSDSRRIQLAVNAAAQSGCNKVVIPCYNVRTGKNLWEIDESILLPSHMYIEINNAHLRMKDGVYCQMFRNSLAFDETGTTEDGLQEDIIIQGIGRALLDGGLHNGLREKTSLKNGLPSIIHNLTIYFHNLRNFKIDGLTIRDQRWWAIMFCFAWDGIVSNIRFEITDKSVRESLDHPWRNQDGIDLRIGCHDIQIFNLTGETCDDVVALTALNGFVEEPLQCHHLCRDIYNVDIRNIMAFDNHCFLVRLLCHNGNQIYNINIDNIIDKTPDDHALEVPLSQRTGVCVRLGDIGYGPEGSRRCQLGEMRNISVSHVYSSALSAVDINCNVKNLVVRDIFVGNQGRHAVAVSKIKAGVHEREDDPANVTQAENVLVDGVFFQSRRADRLPFFFNGLYAKNFRIQNVSVLDTSVLVENRRIQEGSEEIGFDHVVLG